MGWGAPTGKISQTQSGSCQVADKVDNVGKIIGQQTHGGVVEKEEEQYTDADGWTTAAIDGQTGNSVVTADTLTEVNTDFSKQTKKTRIIPGSTP